MSCYRLCAPSIYGHLASLVTVGHGLASRGHDVTMLTGSKYRGLVAEAGLQHVPLPEDIGFDDSHLEDLLGGPSKTNGLATIQESMPTLFVRVIPGQHRASNAVLGRGQFDAVLGEGTFTGLAP